MAAAGGESLEASKTTGRSVAVWFRHAGAYIDAGGNPVFAVERLEYDGQSWSGFRPQERPKDLASTPAELALARGVALERGHQSASALRELDASLETNSLRDSLLPLAIGTRAVVLEKASREAPTKPVRSPCDSAYPEPADYRRERSKLLPKS